jgi:amidase
MISELSRRLRAKEISSVELTRSYLERIKRHNAVLNAFITVDEEKSLAQARAADERIARGEAKPLTGIPIAHKDLFCAKGWRTTCASKILENFIAPYDAHVIEQFNAAGAVILGKTNLSEWANFRSSNSLSGWSSRGGQTRNAYDARRSPSGSSSGSAVAVSANLCAAAIGTETDGSITSPAACNSLVGLKPTLGLVSGAGIVPIAHSQDTAGPMTRTVADCAALMKAICERAINFAEHLSRTDLKGVRIGVARQYFGTNEKADALIEAALAKLKDLGATLVDVEFPSFGKLDEPELEVLFFEFKHDLKQYFRKYAPTGPFASLADVIEYNASNAERMMPIFGQDLLVKAQAKGALTSAAYKTALAKCRKLARAQGIDAVVKKYRIQAITALTSPPPWLIDPVNGDLSRGGCTSMAAVAGYPHLTVPAGFVGGLPVGISFFGPAMSDARLIGIGRAFEAATHHRKAPAF